MDSTAASVPNWSLTAVSSAHSEPFGSWDEEPAERVPAGEQRGLGAGVGASAAVSGPKPWLYSSRVPFHWAGTSATQVVPLASVPV